MINSSKIIGSKELLLSGFIFQSRKHFNYISMLANGIFCYMHVPKYKNKQNPMPSGGWKENWLIGMVGFPIFVTNFLIGRLFNTHAW